MVGITIEKGGRRITQGFLVARKVEVHGGEVYEVR